MHFHTMGIHFEKLGASYELVQTVSIVVDLLHGQTRRGRFMVSLIQDRMAKLEFERITQCKNASKSIQISIGK